MGEGWREGRDTAPRECVSLPLQAPTSVPFVLGNVALGAHDQWWEQYGYSKRKSRPFLQNITIQIWQACLVSDTKLRIHAGKGETGESHAVGRPGETPQPAFLIVPSAWTNLCSGGSGWWSGGAGVGVPWWFSGRKENPSVDARRLLAGHFRRWRRLEWGTRAPTAKCLSAPRHGRVTWGLSPEATGLPAEGFLAALKAPSLTVRRKTKREGPLAIRLPVHLQTWLGPLQ